jgi:C-terminal processing protease CtpA/Prc
MKLAFATVAFILMGHLCSAQQSAPLSTSPQKHAPLSNAGFEEGTDGQVPTGWYGAPSETVVGDGTIAHTGRRSARFERNAGSPGDFSVLSSSIPADFTGQAIQLRGFLKTESVSGFVGLWLREDANGTVLRLDNMQSSKLEGTTGWTQYTVTLPFDPTADKISFGALLQGTGKAWADDLEVLIDGHSLTEIPITPKRSVTTILDSVHDFDHGSGVAIDQISALQIENLATLGRVWGFLKYHHPAVTAGKLHWDYELLQIMPQILQAKTHPEAQAILLKWITTLGPVIPCKPCATLDTTTAAVLPDLQWIHDTSLLGKALSARLEVIYNNRSVGPQFYVSLGQYVPNPSFDHELSYANLKYPDPGFQLLSLFRLWNIMQYWAPDRVIADQDWPQVLRNFIPRLALAKTSDEYQLAMMALIGKANDTHANLWSSIRLRPPTGTCQLPVDVRFVEGRPVVAGYADKTLGPASGLKPGDILEQLDEQSIDKLIEEWTPYYADSNQAARLRDIGRSLTHGACGPATVSLRRDGQQLRVSITRSPSAGMQPSLTHDLPGDTFRLLSSDIAYLKLSSVKIADVPHYLELAAHTKGLIVDIRNYPSEFMVFSLGQALITKPTPFVMFTHADLANPGAFLWQTPITLTPVPLHYPGKVVILVDETSQSQAEYTAIALRSSPNATIVGSTTAGADGNTSLINLPGYLTTMISGLGVYYPDGAQTQRAGVHIDVPSTPTIAGVKAGRDEVLEVGVRQIVGSTLSPAEVEELAHP